MTIRITRAEAELVEEIRELGHGRILKVELDDGERDISLEYAGRQVVSLINLLREWLPLDVIMVADGLPVYVERQVPSKFGTRIKRYKC